MRCMPVVEEQVVTKEREPEARMQGTVDVINVSSDSSGSFAQDSNIAKNCLQFASTKMDEYRKNLEELENM